jgi:hypothetical protein
VWRPQGKGIRIESVYGAHIIAGDPDIREDAEEDINGVVIEWAAIVREDRWSTGIVEEDDG